MLKLVLFVIKDLFIVITSTIGTVLSLRELMDIYMADSFIVKNYKDDAGILVFSILLTLLCRFIYILKFKLKIQSKIKTLNILVHYNDIYKIDWVELDKWLKNQIDYCWDCKLKN